MSSYLRHGLDRVRNVTYAYCVLFTVRLPYVRNGGKAQYVSRRTPTIAEITSSEHRLVSQTTDFGQIAAQARQIYRYRQSPKMLSMVWATARPGSGLDRPRRTIGRADKTFDVGMLPGAPLMPTGGRHTEVRVAHLRCPCRGGTPVPPTLSRARSGQLYFVKVSIAGTRQITGTRQKHHDQVRSPTTPQHHNQIEK